MMLGALIEALEDEAAAEEALLMLGDLVLLAGVREIAARDGETVGTVIADAIGTFIVTAGSDTWLATMRAATDSEVPGAACLRVMLEHALRSA